MRLDSSGDNWILKNSVRVYVWEVIDEVKTVVICQLDVVWLDIYLHMAVTANQKIIYW